MNLDIKFSKIWIQYFFGLQAATQICYTVN